jgi:bifunctional UDP-N-acetylglucosamine pyrophosphorylase/glucosamine-1-phosphate N-acetyltransferase
MHRDFGNACMSESRRCVAVVLAAGQGVRMKSDRPKVLHELCGLPMLAFVLEALRRAGLSDIVVVIGYGAEEIRRTFAAWDVPLRWVEQTEQKGTGHAVMVTEQALAGFDGDVVVVCGDNPLLSADTVVRVLERHRRERASCTVVTAAVPEPHGYGRIVRGTDGNVERIVEERAATETEKRIREINSGNYVFDARELFDAVKRIVPDKTQEEYLLTDVVAVLRSGGRKVCSHPAQDPTEVLGINSRSQLAEAGRILEDRIRSRWMAEGVTIVDPRTTFLDPRLDIGRDTVIMPFTVIMGPSRIGSFCRIGPFVYIKGGTTLADGTEVCGFRELGP